MTRQQYDELVTSVGQSILQTLTEKGLVAKPPAPPSAAQPNEPDVEELVTERVLTILGNVPKVPGAYPDIWTDLVGLPDRLDRTSAGGHGPWAYLGLLTVIAAVGLLVEAGLGRLTLN